MYIKFQPLILASAITITLSYPSYADFELFSDVKSLKAEHSFFQASTPTEKIVTVRRNVNGDIYTFTKTIDENGDLEAYILDPNGRKISEKEVPDGQVDIIQPQLIEWVKKQLSIGRPDAITNITIALDLNIQQPEIIEVGEVEELNGQTVYGVINEKSLTEKELNEWGNQSAKREAELRNRRHKEVSTELMQFAKKVGLTEAKGLVDSIREGSEELALTLNAEQLLRLFSVDDERIAGIEFRAKGEDDINSAMADTNITNWALPFANTQGDDIGIYMTESGCANESRITNYNRLAGSETNHSRNVGAIIRAVSPGSYLYCRGGAVLPQNSDLDGVDGEADIYIVTRSNSNNDNTNYTTLDRSWDNFAYDKKISVFNSGGNTGDGTGNVRSPGKGLNITTVGNYNDSNNTIVSDSPFNDPETGNDKPELSAPGENITAGGFTMGGTSMSTPHAAAFTADMMSSSTYLKNRPHLAKAKLIAGATDPIGGGYNKVGVGGIDFLSSQYSGYWSWWQGGNSSWNYFDNLDGEDDNYVTRTVYISNSWDDVRVALAWMNRGTYTYNNRNDAHPIGMDLDLRVYDPDGLYVGGSLSWDNPFEVVNFQPSKSGHYTFKVNRYANRDSNSAIRMGLYVNYYN